MENIRTYAFLALAHQHSTVPRTRNARTTEAKQDGRIHFHMHLDTIVADVGTGTAALLSFLDAATSLHNSS